MPAAGNPKPCPEPSRRLATTNPPATRIYDAALAKRPLRDATQADQEHEGLAQVYNCSHEHTLLISSSYDCGARASIRSPRSSACGPKCRSTRREERVDRADQLQRPECDPGDGEARGRKRHVVCLSQGRVFS